MSNSFFGLTSKDESVFQYTLTNANKSLRLNVINYGCIITHLFVKDSSGVERDVVLGFDSIQGYLSEDNAYFGAVIGRVANRIKGGTFVLNGKRVQLDKNAGGSHLHGGRHGFDQKIWSVEESSPSSIKFCYTSVDGEENYPGTLTSTVRYSVSDDNEIIMEYSAELMKDSQLGTIINLTNHSYFNLSGCQDEESSKILDHIMVFHPDSKISAILVKDSDLVPTGEIMSLSSKDGSPFNFYRTSDGSTHSIGSRMAEAEGYDHAYIFDSDDSKWREGILEVWSPRTNIRLTMSTTEPSFQFYTGGFLSPTLMSKKTQGNGQVHLGRESAFCLEAQRYPDAINHEGWKKMVILRPNEMYQQRTVYRFDTI